MTSKILTGATHNFLFRSILLSTEEPTAPNLCLESIFGVLYSFIKPIPVRDKQSESFLSIYYKRPLDVGNMTHDKIPGKTGGAQFTQDGSHCSKLIYCLHIYSTTPRIWPQVLILYFYNY